VKEELANKTRAPRRRAIFLKFSMSFLRGVLVDYGDL
jgi:hypothetical protein